MFESTVERLGVAVIACLVCWGLLVLWFGHSPAFS
jgi:hypothetical protein